MIEATGLPSAYCHFVFGQYKFWGQSEPTTLAPLQLFSPAFGKSEKILEGELKFDHIQVIDHMIQQYDHVMMQSSHRFLLLK